jgi:hypothetical protein
LYQKNSCFKKHDGSKATAYRGNNLLLIKNCYS